MKRFFLTLTFGIFLAAGCNVIEENNSEELYADSTNEIQTNEEIPVAPTGWTTYQNNKYGFFIFYPPDWKSWVDPSESYPTQTTGNKYFDYIALDLRIKLSNIPGQASYRDTTYFSVVNFALDTFLERIEGFGMDSTGGSLTSVGAIENVVISDMEAIKSTHTNPNGMVTIFYYIPLIDSEQALFVYYQDMLEEERKDKAEEIINHYLKLYPSLDMDLKSFTSSNEGSLYSENGVQFYFPEEWSGEIVEDQVIEGIHRKEIDFYDQEDEIKMSLVCPEWQGGFETAVSSYVEQKDLSESEGIVSITFVVYDEGELPRFAYLNLPVSSDGDICSLTFRNIQTQNDLDIINSIHGSVASFN